MPAAALTAEPDRVTAGDTVAWSKTLSDYPATAGWTLHYALQLFPFGTDSTDACRQINLTSTASGAAHAIAAAPASTACWRPGAYIWASFVTHTDGRRYSVERGALSILPDPAQLLVESHAQRTLALIEAALEGRIPRGLENTNIDGQELQRIPIEKLHGLRDRYRREVLIERAAAGAAAGVPRITSIGFRFTA